MSQAHGSELHGTQLTTAVPRELVHKRAHTEVLLTGWTTHAENRHTVRAQWPRFHSFYWPRDQRFDPMLFVETFRQSLPLLSHTAYGVPFGNHLIWDDFGYRVDPLAMDVPRSPGEVVLDVVCEDVRSRNGRLASMRLRATAYLDGRRMGTAAARFTNHAPSVYRRIRGEKHDLEAVRRTALPLPPSLPPAAVGHYLPQHVVLSDPDRHDRWQLRADLDHRCSSTTRSTTPRACSSWRPSARRPTPPAPTRPPWSRACRSASNAGWNWTPRLAHHDPLPDGRLRVTIDQSGETCLTAEATTSHPTLLPAIPTPRVPALA